MRKRFLWASLLAIFIVSLGADRTAAQNATPGPVGLTLRLSRDFGYGGLGGDIEGTFSYRVDGPDALVRVEFLLDGEVIGEDTEPPFRLQFHTRTYPLGQHTLSAVGYTSDGQTLQSATLTRNFVDPGESTEFLKRMLLPLGIIIFLAVVLPAIISIASERRNPTPMGAPRKYGLSGGTICPNCGRPYSRHFWGLNVGAGKFDRCPHCGKWRMVRRYSLEALRAAEQAELKQEEATLTPLSEEEKLRRQLEESRFDDV
ncbi:MAG: hypothetical protein Fur0021_22590 [Candidatus Promineifilaceae bacterium]